MAARIGDKIRLSSFLLVRMLLMCLLHSDEYFLVVTPLQALRLYTGTTTYIALIGIVVVVNYTQTIA